jgi:hypothetical protein
VAHTIVAASANEEQVDAIVEAVLEAGLGKGGIRIVYPIRRESARHILLCVHCLGADASRRVTAIVTQEGGAVLSGRWPTGWRRAYTAAGGA